MPPADTLDLDPNPDGVAQALGWLEHLAERDGWTPRQQQGLMLALDEAVTNALMHGLSGQPDPRLRVHHAADADAIRVVLEDNGAPFDPTQVPPPPPVLDLDSLAVGGRGILLMKRVVSHLRYTRTPEGWNRLTLSIDRQPPAA
ncbi:ATP-binding protein [Achromobacter sp. GG226]|uniref:ATP-binding protein n=1 Tax=Verticiella alkaliphila TaxID=2779529 RepID=UPI001C0B825F|nr:ATP-binding protein [Verticiella sp. GG226]MBU4610686.1 ATP-binding protein [Verticiella sp. GG226]